MEVKKQISKRTVKPILSMSDKELKAEKDKLTANCFGADSLLRLILVDKEISQRSIKKVLGFEL
jgi:hypothetical protein